MRAGVDAADRDTVFTFTAGTNVDFDVVQVVEGPGPAPQGFQEAPLSSAQGGDPHTHGRLRLGAGARRGSVRPRGPPQPVLSVNHSCHITVFPSTK